MAYTNKTTNYELPQYIGSDKPSYLGDFNEAMATIDRVMKTNANNIESVGNTTDSIEDMVEANTTNIGSLNSLNTTNKNNLVSAINEVNNKVDENEEYFNLNTFTTISSTDMSLSNNNASIVAGSQLTLATNSDNTLFKLYGKIDVNVNHVTGSLSLTFNTRLRPKSPININNGYIAVLYKDGGDIYSIQAFQLSIATNGVITMAIGTGSTTILQSCILQPCLYFLKDFGD